MDILKFKDKNIYLSPKNNITEFYAGYLLSKDIKIKGYIDSFKTSKDIINKDILNENDYVLIYSPNHWQEIIKTLQRENLYILTPKNDFLDIIHHEKFDGYSSVFTIDINTNFAQKIWWENHLKNHFLNQLDHNIYGYEWGSPENDKDPLGNYLKINNLLQKIIFPTSTILEIGTLGGKWTKYMLNAKKVICVDINSYFIEFIKEKFKSNINKFDFYISRGNELEGITNNSIDLVFCMDTLVRVEKEFIFDYLKEISRVLSKNGQAIIHLPNNDIQDCVNRNFTKLSTNEIINEVNKYFDNYILDSNTIVHGTLLKINIEE